MNETLFFYRKNPVYLNHFFKHITHLETQPMSSRDLIQSNSHQCLSPMMVEHWL